MKKYHLLALGVILIVFSTFYLIPETAINAQDASSCLTLSRWTTLASSPVNHLEAATVVVNGKIFIIGGFKDSALNAFGRVDVYNPQTNIWETVARPRRDLPVNLTHAQAVVDGANIWLAGGFIGKNPGPPTDQVWKYDTLNNLWYAGPSLPAKRSGGGIALIGRNIHYFGGTSKDRDTSYADHWTLNLDNTAAGWQPAPELPNARLQFGTAYVNGQLYVIGGQYRHDHSPIDLPLVHRYDPATGQWTPRASLPFGRSHFEPGTIVYDGQIIIVGGRANQNGYGFGQIVNVTAYNPTTDTWYELPQLPIKLIAPNATIIGDRLIVTTGGTNWNTGQKQTFVATISYTACEEPTPTPEPPTSTPTIELPTETPISTATDELVITPALTETTVVFETATSTDDIEVTLAPTETVVVTETPTETASETPEPTFTPTLTETLLPTDTPEPTLTETPVSSDTR